MPVLSVPHPLLPGVSAIDVIGEIRVDPDLAPDVLKSENDFYSFTGRAGDIVTVEVMSQVLDRIGNTIDSVVRVYHQNADGVFQKLEYNLTNETGSPKNLAFNDDGLEGTDSILLDVRLPSDGQYIVEVDTFSFFLPEFPEIAPPDFDVAAFCAENGNLAACTDSDLGNYELFIYSVQGVTPQIGSGDVVIGGAGKDLLIGSSGDDFFFSDANDFIIDNTGFQTSFVNTAPVLNPLGSQFITSGGLMEFVVSATDAENDPLQFRMEPVDGFDFPVGATFSSTAGQGQFSWTAPEKFVGEVFEVQFIVTDQFGNSAAEKVIITVIPSNTPPTADDDAVGVNEDDGATDVTAALLAGDTDPDASDTLSVSAIDDTDTVGLVTLVGGVVTYDPNGQFESLAVGETANTTFGYTVSDGNGGTDTATVTVTITGQNDDPTVIAAAVSVIIDEGQIAENTGTFDDFDFTDNVNISASMGTITQDSGNTGNWSWQFAGVDDLATSVITITADDGKDGIATTTFDLTVNNVAPSVNAGADTTIDEGSTFNGVGSFTDPGADTWTATVDYGDGSGIQDLTLNTDKTFNLSHLYADNGIYTVTITVTDDNGGTASASTSVTVTNVAPVASKLTLSATTINEDGSVTLSGSFNDAGTQDTHTVSIDWGTGETSSAAVVTQGSGSGTFTATHQYLDDNPILSASDLYTITATVTDNDGGSGSFSTTVTVNNVAPESVAIDESVGELVIAVGQDTPFSGSFSDVGTLDTHSAEWTFRYQEYLAESPTVETRTGTVILGSVDGIVSDIFNFSQSGVYTVTLTVTDDDTGETTSEESMFVVYDPSVGFVTGGGWFNSPEGAYIADTNLTGKANFGFVAKYKKGATTLTGQTEFQFKAGNLNFHSDEYIWLVIAGARAQYQGTGTINGSGNYGFKLTAIDGQVSGGGGVDRIRLKIWDKDVVGEPIVYDSGLGASDDDDPSIALGGGKIIIHSKGNALQAAGGAVIGGTAVQTLSYATLQPVVDQAVQYWASAGADASQLNLLSRLDVQIADLSGSYLGMSSASSRIIWIDVDAAGHGWGSLSSGGMNLLSTVRHELGHQIGLDHDVMGATLSAGSRYLVSSNRSTLRNGSDSMESGESFYAATRSSSLSDNFESKPLEVDIFEPLLVVPKLRIDREEEEQTENPFGKTPAAISVENTAADHLFAEFEESLLDDLMAV
ncbi:MAG: cadherin-like domain-containing protein [Planctomycetes bacterium]|nr:cadherin-like domain-containing protein [Planctomycetota bacterium]